MPNWCANNLMIEGEPTELTRFVQEFTQSANPVTEDEETRDCSFAIHAPIPATQPSATPYWGTRRDVDDCYTRLFGPNEVFIRFDTAWSPPSEWLRKVAQLFPDLRFEMEYYEPGMALSGRISAQDQDWEDVADLSILAENMYEINIEVLWEGLEESSGFELNWTDEEMLEVLREAAAEANVELPAEAKVALPADDAEFAQVAMSHRDSIRDFVSLGDILPYIEDDTDFPEEVPARELQSYSQIERALLQPTPRQFHPPGPQTTRREFAPPISLSDPEMIELAAEYGARRIPAQLMRRYPVKQGPRLRFGKIEPYEE